MPPEAIIKEPFITTTLFPILTFPKLTPVIGLLTSTFSPLFGIPNRGENVDVRSPITGVNLGKVKIGNNVVVMNGSLMMASGGITIDDNTMLAANVQLISNNHDLDNRAVITCLPIHIKKNCWIGAGATILRGITIGENSVVGAGSVVTKDVPDNTVVAGNPARVIKKI